jgi:hypothetical protein
LREKRGGLEEVPMPASRGLFEQFLTNLKAKLDQKGFDFDLKLIKRHLHLYRFTGHHRAYFLSVHESLCSFWAISSNWQEIPHLIPSENGNWAVILLQKPSGGDHPFGFLLSGNDFLKMKSGLGINRMGLIKIHKKDLPPQNEFNDWKSFFRLLKL